MTIEQINTLCTKVPEKYREGVKGLLMYYYANNVEGVFDEAMNIIAYNIERFQSKGYTVMLEQYCSRIVYIYNNLLTEWSAIIPSKHLADMLSIMQDYTEKGQIVELKTMQKQIKDFYADERMEELECFCNHLVNLWTINCEIEDIKVEIETIRAEKETTVTEEEMRKLFWELTRVQTSVLSGGIHSYGDMVLMKEAMIEFRQDLREFRDDIVNKGVTPQVINTLIRIVKKGGLIEAVEDGSEESISSLGCVRVTTNDSNDRGETTTKNVKVSGLGDFNKLPDGTDNIIDGMLAISSGILKNEVCTMEEYDLGKKSPDTFYFITGTDPVLYKGEKMVWGNMAISLGLQHNITYGSSTGMADDVVQPTYIQNPIVTNNGKELATTEYTLTYKLEDNPTFASIDTDPNSATYRYVTFTRNDTGATNRTVVVCAVVTYKTQTQVFKISTITQNKGSLYYKVITDYVDKTLTITNESDFQTIPNTGAEKSVILKLKKTREIDLKWNSTDGGYAQYFGQIKTAGKQTETDEKIVTDYSIISASTDYPDSITITNNRTLTIAANTEPSIKTMSAKFAVASTPSVYAQLEIKQSAAAFMYYWGNNMDEVPSTIPSDANATSSNMFNMVGDDLHKCIYLFVPTSALQSKNIIFTWAGISYEMDESVIEVSGVNYKLYSHTQSLVPIKPTDIIKVELTNK